MRWYVAYSLSYRDLEELMQERDYAVDHSTVQRWWFTMRHASKSVRKTRNGLVIAGGWMRRISKIMCEWKYLHRAVDKAKRSTFY